jgi:hypothetical protein
MGTEAWKEVGSVAVDRRQSIISNEQPIANPYKDQWRGSIIGLSANTVYEVRITYNDPDGVNGTNPATGTITTRGETVPLGIGTTYYVSTDGSNSNAGTETDPFKTIQKAADTVEAGDTVCIKAGTYHEKITIAASGTEGNYITFMPSGDGDVIIDGEGIREYGVSIGVSGIVGTGSGTQQGGHYVRITGLKIINSSYAGVNIGGNNVFVDNCEIRDFNQADDQNADHRTSGITVNNWGATNLTIRNNLIVRNIGTSGFDSPMGIHIRNEHSDMGGGHIITGNVITTDNGQIKDGIGGLPNFAYTGSFYRDSDIYDNYIEGVYDDGIESEGGNINVRIWGNTIIDSQTMGMAIGSTIVGPLYIYRNTICGFTDAAIKMGHESTGATYVYHNTIYTTAEANGPSDFAGAGTENIVSRNNIYHTGRYVIEIESGTDSGNSYDYDNLFTTDSSRFVKWYGDKYTTLLDFQTATGQELNALSVDSDFIDPADDDLRLSSTSECIDAGMILLGFNDANSPWPYEGSAPDIGAFESATTLQPPQPASYFTLTILTNGGGTTNPAPGRYQYAEGRTVIVNAIPDSGWIFDSWTGDIADVQSTVTTTMESDKTITADFKQLYSLSLNTSPPGLITINGEGWYEQGTPITTETVPDVIPVDTGTQYRFSAWTIDGEEIGGNPVSIIMDSSHTVTARYKTQYYLTIESEAGDIEGTGWYDYATRVTTETAPDVDDNDPGVRHVFSSWLIDDSEVIGNPISLTINAPHEVKATYRTQYKLTVESEYGDFDLTKWYNAGTTAQVSVPDSQDLIVRHIFTRWKGDSTDTTPEITITMDEPKTIIAEWQTDYIQLYILIAVIVILAGATVVIVKTRMR